MPRFQILPIDQTYPSTEIIAGDPAGVLYMVQRLGCREADVLRDGDYCFSIRLGDNGLWCIFQRQPSMPDNVERFG